jgi:hypothetical protein
MINVKNRWWFCGVLHRQVYLFRCNFSVTNISPFNYSLKFTWFTYFSCLFKISEKLLHLCRIISGYDRRIANNTSWYFIIIHKTSLASWFLVQSTTNVIILSIKMNEKTFVANFIMFSQNMDTDAKENVNKLSNHKKWCLTGFELRILWTSKTYFKKKLEPYGRKGLESRS